MKKSKTIIFFGTDNFSLTTLTKLFEAGYVIGAVVTKPDSKSGRGQKTKFSAVKEFAINHNIQILQPNKVTEINDYIKNLNQSPIGVLVSYGKIIPESTINLFSPGIINIHPSLLPKYRGSTPIESAIKNGDLETGVSIMKLTPEMDAGDVYSQIKYRLSDTETSPELYEKLADIGASTIVDILPDIADGSLKAAPQVPNATYCKLLQKEEAWLNFQEITAQQAERLIRAYQVFPKTKTNIKGVDIIITKAHISTDSLTPLDIACKQNSHLSIDELIAPSGRKMSAKDFLNGYKLSC